MASCSTIVAVTLAIFVLSSADASKRKITTILYPDCDKYPSCKENLDQNATTPNASFPNLAYIRAVAGEDVLHYVLTTINLPSILVVHTLNNQEATLNFNWDRLLQENATDIAGAISLAGGQIEYSFALVFSRLIEYDDMKDAASLAEAQKLNTTLWNIRNFTQFDWKNVTFGVGQSGKSIIFNTSHPQLGPYGNQTSGYMSFEFDVTGEDGRDDELPRLLYTTNNTQFNFVLDNYVPKYNKSRFALEVSVIANTTGKAMAMQETKSIDDEYSPGVFRVVNWFTGADSTGYIQWKPVCYLDSHRARDVGTEVKHSDLQTPSEVEHLGGLLNQSLARAFFGNFLGSMSTKFVAQSSNISFGLSEDGFYLKNNYTDWTASVGYGSAPVETISTMVIIIISAGLGLPVIIVLVGGIYVCVKKRRGGYSRIDDNVNNSYPSVN